MPISQQALAAMIAATKADLTTAQQTLANRAAAAASAQTNLAAAKKQVERLTNRLKALQQISTEDFGA
jgi:ACT domain-containing protein